METNRENLRLFLAVARLGSLTAAARKLAVSQPTVGRRVQRLESQLGARLFRRVDEQYCLTSIGEGVFERARELEETMAGIKRLTDDGEASVSGRVRVATTDCLAYAWLAEETASIRERYPRIEFELIAGLGIVDLVRKEADIALRVGRHPDQLDSARHKVVWEQLIGVLKRDAGLFSEASLQSSSTA